MLILSRLVDEEIVLVTSDGPIRVMVVSITRKRGGDRVGIGLDAPEGVRIARREPIVPPERVPA